METRVHRLFSASIENRILAADRLEKSLPHVASHLVQCLLNNGKIFVLGQGYAATNSQHFAEVILNHVELERPPLPVMALSVDNTAVRQIQALGQSEDILVILSVSLPSACMLESIQAAHDKEMPIVALTCQASQLSSSLRAGDHEICVPGDTDALIHETQLFVLECFCNLIEQSLFGQAVE